MLVQKVHGILVGKVDKPVGIHLDIFNYSFIREDEVFIKFEIAKNVLVQKVYGISVGEVD